MLDRPLTADELATELKVAVFTINRWRRNGIIPHLDLGDRTKRFDLASVRAALLRRQKNARGVR